MCILAQWPGWCPFWTGWFWIIPLLFVVLCLAGMFFCGRICCGWMRMPWSFQDDQRAIESPLDTAKRRFAKGEISKAEFEDIKKTLNE